MTEGWIEKGGVYVPAATPGPRGLMLGFTARAAGDFSTPGADRKLLGGIGGNRLRLLHQVHGVTLVDTSFEGEPPDGDGWAGDFRPGDFYGVKTADCLPVLIWSGVAPLGAAVHAGWRGATAAIAAKAVKAVGADLGALHAAIGPCIGPCCYEVGSDVAEAAGKDGRWLRATTPGKFTFDLAAYVRWELEMTGIPGRNISGPALCTRCNPALFFSHRADGTKARMVGFIGISS